MQHREHNLPSIAPPKAVGQMDAFVLRQWSRVVQRKVFAHPLRVSGLRA